MNPPFTQEHLLELYPLNSQVKFGEVSLTLGQALNMETLCPAPQASRIDELSRVARLAGALQAAGTLQPDDINLLDIVTPKPGQ